MASLQYMKQRLDRNREANQYGRPPVANVDGDFGIEIEVEGLHLPQRMAAPWLAHRDDSLRGEGVEYVLAGPQPYGEIEQLLDLFNLNLMAYPKTIVRLSHRTSVHVHRNLNRFFMQEIYNLFCLNFIMEKFLVAYSGPDRVGNVYCLRSSDAEFLPYALVNGIKTENYFNSVADDHVRYSSLNPKAVLQYGSAEFRSFRGSVNKDEIKPWVDIIWDLTEAAKDFNSPQDIIKFVNENGLQALVAKIFREPFRTWILSNPSNHQDLYDGFLFAFEIAYAKPSIWEDLTSVRKSRLVDEQVAPVPKNVKKFNINEPLAPMPQGWHRVQVPEMHPADEIHLRIDEERLHQRVRLNEERVAAMRAAALDQDLDRLLGDQPEPEEIFEEQEEHEDIEPEF